MKLQLFVLQRARNLLWDETEELEALTLLFEGVARAASFMVDISSVYDRGARSLICYKGGVLEGGKEAIAGRAKS